MVQTLCIRCGSELKPSSYCELCKQPLIFICTSCEYITEEKVHADCSNANELTKNMTDLVVGEVGASTQAPTTISSASTTYN
jgi:predicted amidophosphoribosyltransferase